jgi:hypothetical protein
LTAQQTGRKSIVLITTADTDILTADRSVAGLDLPEFPEVMAYNPVALDSGPAREDLLQAVQSVHFGTA